LNGLALIGLFSLLVGVLPARADDESQVDHDPCDRKARLRGPVFARGSANIEPSVIPVLDLIASKIKTDCAGVELLIEAHTDTLGDPGYNKRLSAVRAREIKRLLVERGVSAEQLDTVGYGEEYPLSEDRSDEMQALNRRITIVPRGQASHPVSG
jgi:OOP family OmpA-OmpF porin